jgi:hypothetical protein
VLARLIVPLNLVSEGVNLQCKLHQPLNQLMKLPNSSPPAFQPASCFSVINTRGQTHTASYTLSEFILALYQPCRALCVSFKKRQSTRVINQERDGDPSGFLSESNPTLHAQEWSDSMNHSQDFFSLTGPMGLGCVLWSCVLTLLWRVAA